MSGPLGLGVHLGGGAGGGFAFTGPALPPGSVLARASPGSWFDAAGKLAIAPADAPRFDHDPATGRLRGLLIESAATNDIAWSTPDLTHWAKGGGGSAQPPETLDAGMIAPDGQRVSVLRFVAPAGFSREEILGVAGEGGVAVLSIWLAPTVPGRSVALRLNDQDGGTLLLPAGWTRAAVSAPISADGAECQVLLWSSLIDPPVTTDVALWGAQLEHGTRPTSLIPTQGAAASRAADRLDLEWGILGVADGPATIRYTFDDGSHEDRVTTVVGGIGRVPTDLARPWLARATPL